jgi:hypothetical protein
MYIQIFYNNKLCTNKILNYVQYSTTISYVQEINEFKVQRIGFREYATTDVPWTLDDFVEEEFEKLAIYW